MGKTTTAVNLSASLATKGQRVMMVDLDPQGNATMGMGIDKHALVTSTLEVLIAEADVSIALQSSPCVNVQVLGANGELTAAEVALLERGEDRAQQLSLALDEVKDRFDFIVIDCPPSLNMLTINALTAAHSVLIPVQCEYYALEGLSALLDTIQRVRQSTNPGLQVEGLLRTMFDPRANLTREVSEQLVKHFEDKVYATVIPRNIRLAEAPSYGQPAIVFDKASRGSLSYQELAQEMLLRLKIKPAQAGK